MIITKEFVMLNFPKTGSSFVRSVLKQVHGYNALPFRVRRKLNLLKNPPMIELFLPEIHREYPKGLRDQHGTYSQIPEEHKHKIVVSVTRNPFDRYVSTYLFGWWKNRPPASEDTIREVFPQFPDLDFTEYHCMLNRFGRANRLRGISPKIELGPHTIQFIQFYFADPERILRTIDTDYIGQKQYQRDMAEVTFLHQENLNEELHDFLSGMGYPAEKLDFIKQAEKVNITSRGAEQFDTWDFYTPELLDRILEEDRLLFELFPEYEAVLA